MHQLTLVLHCRLERFSCSWGKRVELNVKIPVLSMENLEESFSKIEIIPLRNKHISAVLYPTTQTVQHAGVIFPTFIAANIRKLDLQVPVASVCIPALLFSSCQNGQQWLQTNMTAFGIGYKSPFDTNNNDTNCYQVLQPTWFRPEAQGHIFNYCTCSHQLSALPIFTPRQGRQLFIC